MNDAAPVLTLNEDEALALIELIEDKGLFEYDHEPAGPELKAAFKALERFKASSTGYTPHPF